MTNHYHGDMIGSMRLMTDATSGAVTQEAVYTAFGELRSGSNTRYGYAGAHGYQTDEAGDMPFLHVGARYYDPAIGRFLQRDPIGIRVGLNVYAYVFNSPTIGVDPTGKGIWSTIAATVGVIVGGVLILATTPVWVTVAGVVTVVVSGAVLVKEVSDIWPKAKRIVNPIRNPVRRRNRTVDGAMDCYPTGG